MYQRNSRGGGSSSPRRSNSSRPGRPSFGGNGGGGFRGGRSGGPRRSFGGNKRKVTQFSDISKFVNKRVVEEVVEVFVPKHTFADFAIDERLKTTIQKKGYDAPTPIQDGAIPHVLEGRDVVGIANTGTGKTAAFLIPLINKVLRNPKERVLVVVPTRELAIQIEEEFRGFSRGLKLFSVSCVGGAPIRRQISALRYRNEFVIGTPGRLKDLVERGCIDLSQFGTIVLDEADRMLDMGFINDMRLVMDAMPKERHTLFFSATLSKEIEKLIHDFLTDPVHISVKTRDTAQNIEQDVVRVGRDGNKLDILHDVLVQAEFTKVLIFGRTKHGVEKLSVVLAERGFKVQSIHGDKNQSARQRALGQFKDGRVQILVATDVAARGLDINGVSHVINYELPESYDDYIHRIGRTGRGNQKGKALTFVD
jgi:superfamily II DNA/RNA helicase